MKIPSIPGATPLDDETLRGLIPGLTTHGELDEFEAANIARAMLWAESSRSLKKDLLSMSGLKRLHQKMFEDTWIWAGDLRIRQTNIGVSPQTIQSDMAILLGDISYWLKNQTFPLEEIAIRFHHRLVYIHPFPNGNGRCARLATDLFLKQQGVAGFTWGLGSLAQLGKAREEYIRCLRKADQEGDYGPLLKFAKS
ncbi:mobile mystery protein B [Bdellovibrio bacteriovorus]|uniref:Cell filamentation protein n=1 Tax=Bdellovibrio bacteriovorus str. Tiberius TaxID=1069642 RepID=K7YUS0_BDEBC|nr:mobile mystery protein B [Bdellovibrio bacteriovorus]AFY01388.1 cell filamentation protein [Bdellovibrio bacteriovorus str. Tiberius]